LTFQVATRIVAAQHTRAERVGSMLESGVAMKRTVSTESAPKAVGPYSQAVVANGFVFCSGQVPIDPRTGKLIESDSIADHVRRVMDNLSAVLASAGSGLEQAVKVTIYLADLDDFPEVNRTYATYFSAEPPARATVQVAELPLGARVEIDAVALVKTDS
jgi:2-iminobutanoate/2-iminopropanoate deaminase